MSTPRKFTHYYGVYDTLKKIGEKDIEEKEQWFRLNDNKFIRLYLQLAMAPKVEWMGRLPKVQPLEEKYSTGPAAFHRMLQILRELIVEGGQYNHFDDEKKVALVKKNLDLLTKEEIELVKDILVREGVSVKGISKKFVERIL